MPNRRTPSRRAWAVGAAVSIIAIILIAYLSGPQGDNVSENTSDGPDYEFLCNATPKEINKYLNENYVHQHRSTIKNVLPSICGNS